MSVISGNGVFSHTCLAASDLDASASFHDAAPASLGMNNLGPFGNGATFCGREPAPAGNKTCTYTFMEAG